MISDKDLSSILQKSEKFEAPPAEETPLATDSLGAEMGQPSVPGAVQPGPLSFTERLEQESSPFDEAVTLEEGAREAAIGAVEEGSKSVAALGTGLKFGQRGAQLMAPFFPPYGAVAGGTLGFVTGSVLGYTGADALLQDVFPIPARDELVPYREGGKSFGTAMSLYPVAFYLPAAGPTANRLSRYISEVGDTTRKSPITTGLSTFSASSAMGVAGGTSEAYYPGEAGPRFVAEVAAGFVNPTNWLLTGVDKIRGPATNLVARFSPSAREYRAADILLKSLDEASLNANQGPLTEQALNKIIARLQAPDAIDPKTGEPIARTAAQKTGLPALNAVETALAEKHAVYSKENRAVGVKALQTYELLVRELEKIGDPRLLLEVAKTRAARNKEMLDARFEAAERTAADKIAKITKDTPAARAEIGSLVKSEVDQALLEARTVEKELWDQAYRASFNRQKSPVEDPATGTVRMVESLTPKKVDTSNLLLTYLEFAARSTPERMKFGVPPEIRSIMQRVGIDDVTLRKYQKGLLSPEYLETGVVPAEFLPSPKDLDKISVPDLINIRSDLLSFARDAASKGDLGNASLMGRLAEASLDDLSALKLPVYDVARQYSKDLNDTFTRSYVSDLTATGKRGEKVPPELVISKAFGSNADLTALRMEQIEDAVGFMQQQYQEAVNKFGAGSRSARELKALLPTVNNRITSIRDAQSRALRLAAAKFVDIQTGQLNTKGLVNWAAQNKPALDRLGITPDLEDAERASNAFKLVTDQNSAINKGLRQQAAFAQVLEFDNPTAAITSALNSKKPITAFNRLVKLAKSGGPEAMEGLKSSVYDYVFTQATGKAKGALLSPSIVEKALFDPIAPRQPSIYNILRSQGLMTVQEKNNLRRMLEPMKRVEEALLRGVTADEIVAGADPLTDLALRVVGARIGTSVAPQGPGSLIAASAGSKFVRSIFDKMPQVSITRLIEDATKDPQLMARLLAKGRMPQQQVANRRRLQGYLYAAGYNVVNPEEEPEVTAEEVLVTPTTGPTAAQMLRQLPPAPPTRGVPGLMGQAPAAPPAPPAAGPAAQGPTQSRTMFQSLFPMDTISPLLGQPR